MNQCQTCQFWTPYETDKKGTRGECAAAEAIGHRSEHFSEYKAAVPQACDRFGDIAEPPLLTGPYFGCILHRRKQ